MWVLITGPVGTAKTALAKILVEDGFINLDEGSVISQNKIDIYQLELNYLTTRLKKMSAVKDKRDRNHVVTVRSIWDTAVFAVANEKAFKMTLDECNSLLSIVESAHGIAEKPDIVVYATTTKLNAFDRVAMKHEPVEENYFDCINEEYENFASKITVPLVRIDASMPYDKMRDSLRFYMASVMSTKSAEQTIWKKDFLNELWLE